MNVTSGAHRRERPTDRRLRVGLACLAAGALLSYPAFADQIVYFVNGKAMTVKSVEKGAKFTVLEIDGGGRVGIPTDQIARIEDLETINPYAAQATAPPVPSPQAPAPSAVVPALAAPADGGRLVIPPTVGGAPMASVTGTGSGVGGHPTQPPGGLRPLEIGGGQGGPSRLQATPGSGAYGGGPGGPGAQRSYGMGAMQQAGPGGRRFGGPAMAGRRLGMGGRPRQDLSAIQPAPAATAPAAQATPAPAPNEEGANEQPEDNGSASPATDDNAQEPQDTSQTAPDDGAEGAPPGN